MMSARSKFFDQVLAASLLLAAVIALCAVTIAPLAGYMQTLRDGITEQRLLLGRLLMDREHFATSAANANATTAPADVFLPGSTTATRVANLQARLATLSAGTNIAILSARATTPESRDGMTFAGVEISFRATNGQVRSLLAAIERDRPFLFVDGLQLTPSPDHGNDDPAKADQNDVTLRITGAVEPSRG